MNVRPRSQPSCSINTAQLPLICLYAVHGASKRPRPPAEHGKAVFVSTCGWHGLPGSGPSVARPSDLPPL